MFEFVYPWLFLLVIAPLIVSRLPLYYKSQRTALRISFKEDIDAVSLKKTQRDAVTRTSTLQKWIYGTVLLLALIALAKPIYIAEPLTQEISQREILVSVDLSGSMETKDFLDNNGTTVNRLEAVKMVLADFFKEREGEKIGLILFGSSAFVQSPFTQDLNALEHLLSELRIGMAGPQTALGDSIGLAVKMFQDNNITDRMLIVMSDGDDTGSKIPPLTAAKLATEHGVSIFTIAIGDPKNAGEHPIDTDTLKEIASQSGGEFYYAYNTKELQGIYKQIDKLKPKEVKVITHRPTFDLYYYPLLLVLIILFGYETYLYLRNRRELR